MLFIVESKISACEQRELHTDLVLKCSHKLCDKANKSDYKSKPRL
jgi:hypothetical protein